MSRDKVSSTSSTMRDSHRTRASLATAASLALRAVALGGVVSLAVVIALTACYVLRTVLYVNPVLARERLWLQYGQHKPPYATVQLDPRKYSTPGSVYDIQLELVVPINANNHDLGNFMATGVLMDNAGHHLLTASRPAILSHPSAQACLAPASRSSRLWRRIWYPITVLTRPTAPVASCLTPFQPDLFSGSGCFETLRIPLIEDASLIAPAGFAAVPSKRSTWGFGKAAARATTTGPATALFVQIGRDDAHPVPESEPASGKGEVSHVARPRELQVQEAWLRIEVKLRGLRAFLHRHPYLLLAVFFPSFLSLELAVALAVYVLYVAQSDSSSAALETKPSRKAEPVWRGIAQDGAEDVKPKIEAPSSRTPRRTQAQVPDLPPLDVYEADQVAVEQERAARRMRLGPGGVGMSEAFAGVGGGVESGTLSATATEEEEEEGTEVGESVSEAGAGEREPAASREGGVKREDEEEYDDEGTLAGSAITRRTSSTFGPSLAGTTSTTRSTGLSVSGPSTAGLRGRGGPGALAGADGEDA